MKNAFRILIVALALVGSIAATVDTVKADSGSPPPTCDPTTSKCTG